jgi:hypothetical protein
MDQSTKAAVEIDHDDRVWGDHSHDFRRTYHSMLEIPKELAEHIARIRGVEPICLRRYSIEVTKALLFSWDEVEPAVLELLGK